jgi:hypothetical protein
MDWHSTAIPRPRSSSRPRPFLLSSRFPARPTTAFAAKAHGVARKAHTAPTHHTPPGTPTSPLAPAPSIKRQPFRQYRSNRTLLHYEGPRHPPQGPHRSNPPHPSRNANVPVGSPDPAIKRQPFSQCRSNRTLLHCGGPLRRPQGPRPLGTPPPSRNANVPVGSPPRQAQKPHRVQ